MLLVRHSNCNTSPQEPSTKYRVPVPVHIALEILIRYVREIIQLHNPVKTSYLCRSFPASTGFLSYGMALSEIQLFQQLRNGERRAQTYRLSTMIRTLGTAYLEVTGSLKSKENFMVQGDWSGLQ